MKHVFWIHNHTTYLTAKGVIEKLKLPSRDIVFVLARNYKCFDLGDEIPAYDMSDIVMSPITESKRHVADEVEIIDKFINEKVGEVFTFYIPHLCAYIYQVFLTHKLCADIKFIQEGIIDCCTGGSVSSMSLRSRLKQLYLSTTYRGWRRFWKAAGWDDYKYGVKHASESFSITDSLFSKADCKHTIVEWPKMTLPISLENDGVYFVFESLVEQRNIEKEVFLEASGKLIMKFGGIHNYVKFHPAQKDENKGYIKSLFSKNGFHMEQLPDNVPFEMILANQPHMKVCGFTTSLVFFAALMPQHEAHICVPALYKSKRFIRKSWKNFESNLKRCYGDRFMYEEL